MYCFYLFIYLHFLSEVNLKEFFIYIKFNEERGREKHFEMSVLVKYITYCFKDSPFFVINVYWEVHGFSYNEIYLTVYSVVISSKVHDYLKSSSWETRIAAGQAVSAIARNVPKWNKKIPIKQG